MNSTKKEEGRQATGVETDAQTTGSQPTSRLAPTEPMSRAARQKRPKAKTAPKSIRRSQAALLAQIKLLNQRATEQDGYRTAICKERDDYFRQYREASSKLQQVERDLERTKAALRDAETKNTQLAGELTGERRGFTAACQLFASQGKAGGASGGGRHSNPLLAALEARLADVRGNDPDFDELLSRLGV